MVTTHFYCLKAVEFQARAQKRADPVLRNQFESLARGYLRLAEQAERNTHFDGSNLPSNFTIRRSCSQKDRISNYIGGMLWRSNPRLIAVAICLLLPVSGSSIAGPQAPHSSKKYFHGVAKKNRNIVPGPYDSPRVPPYDYRRGTSDYPFGPGINFPYPDRPYGDPDRWGEN